MPLSNSKPAEVKYCHVWLAPTHINTDTQTNSDSHTHTHVSTHTNAHEPTHNHTHTRQKADEGCRAGDLFSRYVYIFRILGAGSHLMLSLFLVLFHLCESTHGGDNSRHAQSFTSAASFYAFIVLCYLSPQLYCEGSLSPCFYCASMSVCFLLLHHRLAFSTVILTC